MYICLKKQYKSMSVPVCIRIYIYIYIYKQKCICAQGHEPSDHCRKMLCGPGLSLGVSRPGPLLRNCGQGSGYLLGGPEVAGCFKKLGGCPFCVSPLFYRSSTYLWDTPRWRRGWYKAGLGLVITSSVSGWQKAFSEALGLHKLLSLRERRPIW